MRLGQYEGLSGKKCECKEVYTSPVLQSNPISAPSTQKGSESTCGQTSPTPEWEMKGDVRPNHLREKPADPIPSRQPRFTGTEFSTEGHEDHDSHSDKTSVAPLTWSPDSLIEHMCTVA